MELTEQQIEGFERRKEQQNKVFESISETLIQNIYKTARKTKECPYCGTKRKKITIEKPTTYYEEIEGQGSRRLNPIEIRERLEQMTDSDCHKTNKLYHAQERHHFLFLDAYPSIPQL